MSTNWDDPQQPRGEGGRYDRDDRGGGYRGGGRDSGNRDDRGGRRDYGDRRGGGYRGGGRDYGDRDDRGGGRDYGDRRGGGYRGGGRDYGDRDDRGGGRDYGDRRGGGYRGGGRDYGDRDRGGRGDYGNRPPRQDEIHSIKIRAGKRTYIFDVRATRRQDYYITITERKRDSDGFGPQKQKLFLYKEDFEKFGEALQDTINYVRTELLDDQDFERRPGNRWDDDRPPRQDDDYTYPPQEARDTGWEDESDSLESGWVSEDDSEDWGDEPSQDTDANQEEDFEESEEEEVAEPDFESEDPDGQ